MSLPACFGVLAAALASFLLYGYSFGTDLNLDQVLPFIQVTRQPQLYPGDAYIATAAAFPSWYPRFMAALAGWLPLSAVHLGLYVLAKLLLLVVVYRLAETLWRDQTVAWLACWLVALSPVTNVFSLFGEDPIMKQVLFQTSLAAPFAVLVLHWFIQRRYLRALTLLGVLYYVNALMANFLVVMCGCASWKAPRNVWKGWLAFAVICGPWAAWLASLPNPYGGATPHFAAALRFWYPGHYFPADWSLAKWWHIAVYLGFSALFLVRRPPDRRHAAAVRAMTAACLAMWVVAYAVGGLAAPPPRLVVLQLFRSDALFTVLALIFGAAYLRQLMAKRSVQGVALGLLLVLGLTEVAGPYYGGAILALLLLAEQGGDAAARAGALGVLGLSAYYAWAVPLGFWKILLVGACAGVVLLIKPRTPVARWWSAPGLAAALAALALMPVAGVFGYRIGTGNFRFASPARQDWEAVQRWAKQHTPPSSLFVVPLYWDGFRVLSERPVFVEWIDGSAMHWAPGFEREWLARMRRLRIGGAAVPEDAYRTIAADYGADYVVAERGHTLSFPLVFANPSFRVYALQE